MTAPAPIANAEQAESWNGDDGAHWVAHEERYDALTGAFNDHLFTAAAIRARDMVLDVGCGNGQTTRLAARAAGEGRAVGLDLSATMLERARATAAAEGVENVTFKEGDAQVHPIGDAAYDVAISRFGVMFFADPVAAFTRIGRALRSGGRLAFLCWQDASRNDWLMVPASAALQHVPFPNLGGPDTPGPFSLADPARMTAVLTAAGFASLSITPVEAAMLLGRDADDAVGFLHGTAIAQALLDQVAPTTADRALAAIAEALRPYERPDGLRLGGAAWLVTASRP